MNNPIGIFDSGLGGLTVLEEIRGLLPQESLVYVADSAFAPYGNQDDTTIVQRCEHIAQHLIEKHNIKALVVACNTATAAAIQVLREQLDIPVIGMEPAIKPAVDKTESGVVGVLATANTLKSNKFSNLLDAHQHQARIITQPCAGWVEAIEQCDLNSGKTKLLVRYHVQPLLDKGADTLVLGCTHYPWLEPLIRELAGENIHIISTGAAVAKQVQYILKQHHALNTNVNQPTYSFYTSGGEKHASIMASKLLQRPVIMLALPSVAKLSSLSA